MHTYSWPLLVWLHQYACEMKYLPHHALHTTTPSREDHYTHLPYCIHFSKGKFHQQPLSSFYHCNTIFLVESKSVRSIEVIFFFFSIHIHIHSIQFSSWLYQTTIFWYIFFFNFTCHNRWTPSIIPMAIVSPWFNLEKR